ncbi:MAG: hypothetical protein F6K16_09960 [Symploca sp. SIO2B6]|nr:hypothetical protein [Symploca sp. SIO2B6]
MGRWGDGGIRRWGDGEMGRFLYTKIPLLPTPPYPSVSCLGAFCLLLCID